MKILACQIGAEAFLVLTLFCRFDWIGFWLAVGNLASLMVTIRYVEGNAVSSKEQAG